MYRSGFAIAPSAPSGRVFRLGPIPDDSRRLCDLPIGTRFVVSRYWEKGDGSGCAGRGRLREDGTVAGPGRNGGVLIMRWHHVEAEEWSGRIKVRPM